LTAEHVLSDIIAQNMLSNQGTIENKLPYRVAFCW